MTRAERWIAYLRVKLAEWSIVSSFPADQPDSTPEPERPVKKYGKRDR